MVQNGLMTRNEGRKTLNLPAVDGGDDLTAQVNMATLDRIAEPPQPMPEFEQEETEDEEDKYLETIKEIYSAAFTHNT